MSHQNPIHSYLNIVFTCPHLEKKNHPNIIYKKRRMNQVATTDIAFNTLGSNRMLLA